MSFLSTLTACVFLVIYHNSLAAYINYNDPNGPICSTERKSVTYGKRAEKGTAKLHATQHSSVTVQAFGRQLQQSSVYQQCDLSGSDDCPNGTLCHDTPTGHRCLPALELNEECSPADAQPCGLGLECRSHRCKPVLREGEACDTSPKSTLPPCSASLICAGTMRRRRCVKPMGLGQPCQRDIYWVCGKGLSCRYYRCVHKLTTDCDCGAGKGLCEVGSVCKGDVNTRVSRCTTIRRLDTKQWVFVAASAKSWVYLNGVFLEQTIGWENVASIPAHVNMGDVLAIRVQGAEEWSAFIVAVGSYQPGKPNWAVRSGGHEFLATKEFDDPQNTWMHRDYNACAQKDLWQRVRYAPRDAEVEVGAGKPVNYPYWTGARFMWARDVEFGATIFVRFKRGGHRC